MLNSLIGPKHIQGDRSMNSITGRKWSWSHSCYFMTVRARNIDVWQIDSAQSQALATVALRSMQLQVSVQDGTVWVGDGQQSIEITPRRLNEA